MEAKVLAAFDATEDRDPKRWVLDTGATNHMTGSRSAFSDLDNGVVGTVRFGDGSVVNIEGRGTILFACKNGEHRTLANAYYIPRLTTNIISVGQLDEVGFEVLVKGGVMWIRDEEQRLLAKVHRSPSRLYVLDVNIARPVCLAAHATEDAWLWHARFGHVNFGALRKMGREKLVRGMPLLEHVDQLCDACLAGKHRWTPFPQRALSCSTEVLQLLHGDLCGPITPPTPSGNRYFLLLVDDYSRYMWIMLLPSKDAAAGAIKRVQAAAERKTGKLVRALRTDRGGEFLARDFEQYCAELGLHRELTAPYSPQQNGVVERRNQSVVSTARSMLMAKGLPGMFWGEAVTTAVYLLNRSSSKSIGGKTPYELWTGSPPGVHHLRTFGCIAHMKITAPNQRKLDDRSRRTIFVGYEPSSKAYRVFDPQTRRIHISRDVVFDEAASWSWRGELGDAEPEFQIEVESVEQQQQPGTMISTTTTRPASAASSTSTLPAPTASPANQVAGQASPTTPVHAAGGAVEFASPPAGIDVDLDADHDEDAPLRFRKVHNVLGPSSTPGLAQRELEEHLLLASDVEPTSFAEAQKHEWWRHAMLDEMTAIEANSTWELVDPPPRVRPIGLKWVYKAKKDAARIISKYKAWLVAKGYVRQQGIDFDEVFAPVARLESVRLLLAHAANEGWAVHHMDIKSAFLNGELQEEVFVEQPPGFVLKGQEGKVLRLVKALYGLRQALHAWYAKLDSSLLGLGFGAATPSTLCISAVRAHAASSWECTSTIL
jgi:transposase InsO family protein